MGITVSNLALLPKNHLLKPHVRGFLHSDQAAPSGNCQPIPRSPESSTLQPDQDSSPPHSFLTAWSPRRNRPQSPSRV